MRVLLVGPHRDDPGGVANYYNSVLPHISPSDVSIDYLEIGSTPNRGFWLHKLTDQARFWRELARFDPDVVHINPQLDLLSFVRDGLFVLAAKHRRKPVLIFFHGWRVPFERHVAFLLLWFFRATYRHGDAFVVLAERFARKLRTWGATSPIYCGFTAVDDGLLNTFSLEQKCDDIIGGVPLRLLFLARLIEQKGLFEFLEGFRLLLERRIDARATVAGDGPLMGGLKGYLDRYPDLRQRVEVVGYVAGQAKARVLREHHVFCSPTSFPEGMPTALLEAMAFGMSVITCRAGGIGDFFEPRRMGIMLATPDPEMIANGMQTLLENRQRLADIARYNHEYAVARFLASDGARFLRTRYLELNLSSPITTRDLPT